MTLERIVESSESSAYFAASSERRALEADAAIEDRPAVLGLADLQVRRVLVGLERIALRVDQEQARRLAAYLAAQDQVHVELEVVALERGAVHVGDAADLLADDARGVVERRRLREALALVEVAPQQGDDRLRAATGCRWLSRTKTRSPGCSKVCILRQTLTWS